MDEHSLVTRTLELKEDGMEGAAKQLAASKTGILRKGQIRSPLVEVHAKFSSDVEQHYDEANHDLSPHFLKTWDNRRRSVTLVEPSTAADEEDILESRRRSSSLTDENGDSALTEYLEKKKGSFRRGRTASAIKLHITRPRIQPLDRSMSSPIEQTAMQSMILHTEDDIPESPPPPHEFNNVSDSDMLKLHNQSRVADLEPPTLNTRRGSFLYADALASRRLSRCSSQSSHVGDDIYITPFAQILANLYVVRSSFVDLMGLPPDMHKGPVDHITSTFTTESKKKLAVETLSELDWCMEHLETLNTSKSVGELAQSKFRQMLANVTNGTHVAQWVTSTYQDRTEMIDEVLETRHERRQRRSSGNLMDSIPKYGIVSTSVNEEDLGKFLKKNVSEWTLDVFHLKDITDGRPLMVLSYYIFKERDLFKTFKIPPNLFIGFMTEMENLYTPTNHYHNSCHGADVMHTVNNMLQSRPLQTIFQDLEIMAALFAAAIHDVDHPGTNNDFLVRTSHELALLYNDESVLENHHLYVTFSKLNQLHLNFLVNVDASTRSAFRKMTIDMVLATDMGKHLQHIGELKTMVETKKLAHDGVLTLDRYFERSEVLQCLVHCADLSNPSKDVPIAKEWTSRVMNEFFLQGDIEREKGLPISPLMDRHAVNVPKCQASFIEFVVYPLWEVWSEFVYPHSQHVLDRLNTTLDYWTEQIPPSPPKEDKEDDKEENPQPENGD